MLTLRTAMSLMALMKNLKQTKGMLLALGICAVFLLTSQTPTNAQTLFDENSTTLTADMAGGANSTSILDNANNATSNPQYYSYSNYEGGGTVSTTAGVIAGPPPAFELNSDYSNATIYYGSQLFSPEENAVVSGTTSLSDYSFSVTSQFLDSLGSGGHSFLFEVLSYTADYSSITGTIEKSFTLNSSGTYQTFSGTLGDSGFAPNSSYGPNSLVLNAPHYQFEVETGAFGGFSAGADQILDVSDVNLTASEPAIPEPKTAFLLVISMILLMVAWKRKSLGSL